MPCDQEGVTPLTNSKNAPSKAFLLTGFWVLHETREHFSPCKGRACVASCSLCSSSRLTSQIPECPPRGHGQGHGPQGVVVNDGAPVPETTVVSLRGAQLTGRAHHVSPETLLAMVSPLKRIRIYPMPRPLLQSNNRSLRPAPGIFSPSHFVLYPRLSFRGRALRDPCKATPGQGSRSYSLLTGPQTLRGSAGTGPHVRISRRWPGGRPHELTP